MFDRKILAIGNETEDTDLIVSKLASEAGAVNYGLINSVTQDVSRFGYYHTSIVDLTPGDIVSIAAKFDSIVLLDQPIDSYPHAKSFVFTVRLMFDLESQNLNTEFRNNKSTQNLLYWKDYLWKNKSFCFYPFLGLVSDLGSTVFCGKSPVPIVELSKIKDWQTDPSYLELRNKMAKGELMPNRCSDCYSAEAEGHESARQFETLEWAGMLNFTSVDDFFNVKSPYLYEIRPNNKCNILCRTCDDAHSSLIEKEWQKSTNKKVFELIDWRFNNTPFEKIDFTNVQRIYYAGGEPTVMKEFYEFLTKCIDSGNTNFTLLIGTNGMCASKKLLDLLKHFKEVTLAFSYDGYRQINDYIRWKSDFDTMIKNGRIFQEHGHEVSLQTVFSMWNAARIHEIFEFFDQEYPTASLLVQPARGQGRVFEPYNHPMPELVIESMERCKQTNSYHKTGRSVKSFIDAMYTHYTNPDYKCDLALLEKFYTYSDELDKIQGTNLGDYIPELEEGRKRYFG